MSFRIADELALTSGTRCLGVTEVVASGLSSCMLALGELDGESDHGTRLRGSFGITTAGYREEPVGANCAEPTRCSPYTHRRHLNHTIGRIALNKINTRP